MLFLLASPGANVKPILQLGHSTFKLGHQPTYKVPSVSPRLLGDPRETRVSRQQVVASPIDDVVAQVSLEQEAPALDSVEQGLLKGAAVALQPAVENLGVLTFGHLLVQLLV